MILPDVGTKSFSSKVNDIVERCRVSVSARAMMCRSLKQWRYTGSNDGTVAIYNRLNGHIEKLTSYLYSPSDLRYSIEYMFTEPSKLQLEQQRVAAKYLTRRVEESGVPRRVGGGVDCSLTYGTALVKLLWGNKGLTGRIVFPWNFGVYREDIADLDAQEAMCETVYIGLPDLWRRISHMKGAQELYDRARKYAKRRAQTPEAETFFHQVLLAAQPPAINTTTPTMQQPGGLIQVTADPVGGIISPEVLAETIALHEITVLNDKTGDYTTIQMADPDIIIEPYLRCRNLFVEGEHPYVKIQPNEMEGYFWGRSELADLLMLQSYLAERVSDIKKLHSLQYDRILAMIGFSGMNDERYDQLKHDGWLAEDSPAAKIQDLTPPLPPGAFTELKEILGAMDDVSGFNNILSGQGEQGVRAGNHAQMLMRTASPRLRDRTISVEESVAEVGGKALELLAAKDATQLVAEKEGFLLSQLPNDLRVTVDSHSASPIYEVDHMQQAMILERGGAIGPEGLLELISVPHKERLLEQLKERQAREAEMIREHPELLEKHQGKKKAA